mmetsp:Transcript_94937/g.163792  ORF Transcript_94937/g.163792 Transcript_94937/m.163792 type:complete len:259 (+) Transcript_94937:15562-16338(+)
MLIADTVAVAGHAGRSWALVLAAGTTVALLTDACAWAMSAVETIAMATADTLGTLGTLPRAIEPKIVGLARAVPTATEAVVTCAMTIARVAHATRAVILAHLPPCPGVAVTGASAGKAIIALPTASDAIWADAGAIGSINVGLAHRTCLALPEALGRSGKAGALSSTVLAVVAVAMVVAGVACTTWAHILARGSPVPRLTGAESTATGTGVADAISTADVAFAAGTDGLARQAEVLWTTRALSSPVKAVITGAMGATN